MKSEEEEAKFLSLFHYHSPKPDAHRCGSSLKKFQSFFCSFALCLKCVIHTLPSFLFRFFLVFLSLSLPSRFLLLMQGTFCLSLSSVNLPTQGPLVNLGGSKLILTHIHTHKESASEPNYTGEVKKTLRETFLPFFPLLSLIH